MGRKIKAKANMNKSKQREYKSPDTTWIFPKEPPPRKCMEVKTRTATINFFSRYFYDLNRSWPVFVAPYLPSFNSLLGFFSLGFFYWDSFARGVMG